MPDAPPQGVPIVSVETDLEKRRELADIAVDEAERIDAVRERADRRRARTERITAAIKAGLDILIWVLTGGIATWMLRHFHVL